MLIYLQQIGDFGSWGSFRNPLMNKFNFITLSFIVGFNGNKFSKTSMHVVLG